MQEPVVTIRPAGETEIPLIQDIAYRTWPSTYEPILGKDQLAYMLNLIYSGESLRRQMEQGSRFVLLSENDKAIGFAAYLVKSEGIYKLDKLYALPQSQGKGYGKMLLNFVVREAKSLGAHALHLNVNRYNSSARSFYEKMHFKIIEEADIAIGSGFYMNDYIMELKL